FDGKLIAAIVNKLANLSGRLSYEFEGEGDNLAVTVSGTFAGESEPKTVRVTVKEAKTDNQMWKKDPHQKLVYTGATRWARRHCPEVILGIVSDDEPPAATVEAVSVTAPAAEPPIVIESAPLDLPNRIAQFKSAIESAESHDELEKIVDRINAELAMPEPAREDLKKVARQVYAGLSEPVAAG
ncbi:MAG: recombinase RecT, partial [Planctomycetota bacterium]